MTGCQHTPRQRLKELCTMHPNDPIFHHQLARHFLDSGHEIRAILQARKAYEILNCEHPEETQGLIDEFGHDITTSHEQPVPSGNYTPLAKKLGRLKYKMRQVHLTEGSILFKKGDHADYVYFIIRGELAVTNHNNQNNLTPSLINFLREGSLLGEGALYGQVRNATVVATTDTTLLKMTPKELQLAFVQNPELHLQFSKESLLRQRVARLTISPAFSCLPTDLRFMLAKRAWDITHPAKKVVKPASQHMTHVELITQGKIRLYEQTTQENRYCGRLDEGSILGLHKIIDGKASQLAYVTKYDCQVICMNFVDVEDLMDVSSRFRERIRNAAASFSTNTARVMSLQEEN
ncbi:MAG: cyclic nucleotide-binding domain-containing protein [Ghiorsea sp.]|nr:cyclic nucleotide-binding domain-containing protein [Ghiorsea sp.]